MWCDPPPHGREGVERNGTPTKGALDSRRGGLGPRDPAVCLHIPNLVFKQLRRWNPPQGPREEALLTLPSPQPHPRNSKQDTHPCPRKES